jgi:hypothetical protein
MGRENVTTAILGKVKELSRPLGRDASALKGSDIIPMAGVLDSAALMELMVWYEAEFGLSIPQADFTLENFGSADQMANYVALHRNQS